jgi:hemolysin III
MSIFGAAIILLYAASTVYHTVNVSERVSNLMRRIDHIMIFILIAGTYTPVCLMPLRGPWGFGVLTGVWAMAVMGFLIKIFWMGAPRWFSTALYVIMGWLVVIAFVPLIKSISPGKISLLAAGGVTYTLGAVIYATKWPRFKFPHFGFHELFHVFVMGGSACHIAFMFML